MLTHVLFDLDGTLTDPAMGITGSIRYALKQMNRPIPSHEELLAFIGPPLIPAFESMLGMTNAEAKEALRHYRVYFSETGLFENTPYPGIDEALTRLTNRGIRLYVATSKPEVFAERILRHFGLAHHFAGICGASLDETRTAKGDVIRYALGKIDDPAARILMVGDRQHDVLGAEENGLPAMGVLWGYGSREELTDAGARILADSPEKMADLILAM